MKLTDRVVNSQVQQRNAEALRKAGVVLPKFSELADPSTIDESIQRDLQRVGFDEPHPLNLFRVHWHNTRRERAFVRVPEHVVLPPSLTGVDAKIVVLLGNRFPMIRAHKVLAAYACLAPRIASGEFDLSRHRAVWPSTGNYCRGGVAVSRIVGCRGVAVLPAGMSAERFRWLEAWAKPEDIVRTPGTESNVKEIYDKCAELARDPANEIVNQFCEFGNYLVHWRCTGLALARIFETLCDAEPDLKLAGFVAASGSAGTLGAGDFLKSTHSAKIAVVEAVECPTLLMNGYGEHNIQGIGDKHVPLIHNVMNTDLVIGVSDQATDGLNAAFNTDEGCRYLACRAGVVVRRLRYLGLSSIANVLGAIKMAKHYGLGPNDVILSVATDGHELYESELKRYLQQRHNMGRMTERLAAELVGEHLQGAGTEHVLEMTERERARIFNLGYFTWVEQQGIALADFERRRSQTFWTDLHALVPVWDEMITAFNRDSGMAVAD